MQYLNRVKRLVESQKAAREPHVELYVRRPAARAVSRRTRGGAGGRRRRALLRHPERTLQLLLGLSMQSDSVVEMMSDTCENEEKITLCLRCLYL